MMTTQITLTTPAAGSNVYTQPVSHGHLPRPVPPAGLRQVVLLGYYGFRHVSLVRRLHVIGTPGRAAPGGLRAVPRAGSQPGVPPRALFANTTQVSVKRYDDDDDVVDDGGSLLPTSLVGANEGGGMEVRVEGRPERRREGKKKGGRKAGLAGPAGTVWV